MNKSLLSFSLLMLVIPAASVAQDSQKTTVREVIAEITNHVGVPPRPGTVDTFKAGDPDTPVTGIAVTMKLHSTTWLPLRK